MRPTRSYQVGLLLIIVAYLAIGVIYALSTPPLEASDEFKHYPLVQYVQTHHALPVLKPDAPGPWLQEGTQPPLYYLVMAALTSWIDTSDLPGLRILNPHAFIGIPNQVGNKNLILHQPDALGMLLDYLAERGFNPKVARAEAIGALQEAIAPRRSGTFRKARPGNWREHFTEANKAQFKEQAGDLLIELGYETGLDW